jgi:hypothetical protein
MCDMSWPALTTYDRVNLDNGKAAREEGYEKSYFGMRLVIGVIGLLLPVLLVVVDWLLLDQPASVRGSMSAYYHSPARDLFVGGLSACGVTLVSYMFWKWWTWDFLISLVGGLAVLGIAAFPTARPRPDGSTDLTCSYVHEGVPPCSAIQQGWGEQGVRTVHVWVTVFVVASFALLCLLFALREFGYGRAAHTLVSGTQHEFGPRRIWRQLRDQGRSWLAISRYVWKDAPRIILYLLCLTGVLAGAACASLGKDGGLPHTYVGEFVAFSSFGSAWIGASWDLLKRTNWVNSAVMGMGHTLGVGG